MFLTNPYTALRGISVPLDFAFPCIPRTEGCYRSGVSCCFPVASPLVAAGARSRGCAQPARAPPCPALPSGAGNALPASLLEWLCLLPSGCSASDEGPSTKEVPVAVLGLGRARLWLNPALLPARPHGGSTPRAAHRGESRA